MENLNWHKIKLGDKKEFKVLFDEYYSSLCLYANTVVNNVELAQDVVSDCFVRIWERRESIEIQSSLKHYLLLSVRNAIYSYLRSPENRKTDINTIISKLENTPIDDYDLERDATLFQVHELIGQLPEQRKRILQLAALEGKTYKEIAQLLSISTNTVKTQMVRAYNFLRDELNKHKVA
jgi:RNA polymerase sigma-70 factor (ECF subfamily)